MDVQVRVAHFFEFPISLDEIVDLVAEDELVVELFGAAILDELLEVFRNGSSVSQCRARGWLNENAG